ncbi:hypothetical protein [Limosilactobacillus reuteri]|uniref:hypothetical protein n=1 Tax=Limosilactobacillus reuteri TaxID=1598 RepID=UPI003CC1046A
MTKQDEFNLRKEKEEQQLKAIRDAAASNNPDQALADQREVITAIKGKTQEKLKSLKQRKQANYSLAKKKANKRWDDGHKKEKRYITYRSRAKKFVQLASSDDLKQLDQAIHERLD